MHRGPFAGLPASKQSASLRRSRRTAKHVLPLETCALQVVPPPKEKNKVESAAAPLVAPKPRVPRKTTEPEVLPPLLPRDEIERCTTLQQPKLPFDLQEAKVFLCAQDPRFIPLFEQVELTMYDEMLNSRVKDLNLFQTLTTSILGQQISWLAARSIKYKLCRLFAPHLPETPDYGSMSPEQTPFPSPLALLDATDDQLRYAGLSGAKMKYVRDVARRFADGRLDVRRIVHMDYQECVAELTQVKGVGRWTAEMLLMFALRNPNVLPVGDLGVQRGIVFFYLSGAGGPLVMERKRKKDAEETKERLVFALGSDPLPLPQTTSLSHAVLRSRAQGNKTKKNMYLDEAEMEALAAPWAPFRSVACMFMWSMIDK
ncbi:DNA-3-methyladenine glycosylase II [Malassezia vespertilionis]|uniref:HhH-GPD domain-containing protein n=1 Tax=Malassezia vespertilionis TaxID=2020962 RepID=A0A2N1J8H6_9BASI|nr:DNA-3-methyladenine glycosylase II [Malassezia vespertilionis]PKI82855.1 hypothetical protein MVES_003138 [Malassezia vespertilionis]WFD08193.1 DNA-3-methyladenine glycosylase II [Malassezia vespertilionis]